MISSFILIVVQTNVDMAVLTPIPSYDLWTDAPGTLFTKAEWEKANEASNALGGFGSLPDGWPRVLTGPQVWTGDALKAHREHPPSPQATTWPRRVPGRWN